MGWRCSGCGESHEDAFTSCWRCGTARAPTAKELAEEAEQARADALEDAAMGRESAREAAILSYEDQAGWVPPLFADRATSAGAALHRLVAAYRLYRARQERSAQRPRPDLDRAWRRFFVSCAVMGGMVLTIFTRYSIFEVLGDHENVAVSLWMGGLLLCVVTGHRAVTKELRAAAEAAVDSGREPVRRVS